MTDLEMTKLCAEAMGYTVTAEFPTVVHTAEECSDAYRAAHIFAPLHDDAQAMALVKRFELSTCAPSPSDKRWQVLKIWGNTEVIPSGYGSDLNRTIVECVAKMQAAKVAA